MCLDHRMTCQCKGSHASFNFRNEVLPVDVIKGLYCPVCSTDINYNHQTMLSDNGWIIEFDMDLAEFARNKLPAKEITPDFLFDEGYCTWRGIYPTDHIDSVKERENLVKLSTIDKKKYIEEFKRWTIQRMERLAEEGWRKAHEK